MFKQGYHPAFKKDLKNLPQSVLQKLEKAIDLVIEDPLHYENLKGELKDVKKLTIKHLGIEYRLAFTVLEDTVVFLMFKKKREFLRLSKKKT